jgi:hypothetical protein
MVLKPTLKDGETKISYGEPARYIQQNENNKSSDYVVLKEYIVNGKI